MTRIPSQLVLIIFGAIAVFSILNVQFSANVYEMLPEDLPEVQGMDRLSRFFNRDGQLIITVEADESFAVEEAIESLTARLEEHPEWVADVFKEVSLTEIVTEGGGLIAWLWLNSSAEKVAELQGMMAPSRSEAAITASMKSIQGGFLDQAAIISSYDPLGLSRISDSLGGGGSGPDPMTSESGTFQLIYVEGNGVNFSNYREASVWLEGMRTLVDQWEVEWLRGQAEGTRLDVGLTGTPAFMAEVGSVMEKDLTISVFATMILISILFWIMHRRTKPLSWLVSAMFAILAITLAVGGLIFGDLSVMSAGFAAILMGLAVDYGIIIYREAIDTGLDAKGLRKAVGPGILWAASTTAVVFLSLNLSSMRGLSEMGNLVAMGVMIGAFVMLFFFAPIAVQFTSEPPKGHGYQLSGGGVKGRLAGILAWLIPAGALLSVALTDLPGLEANFHPFRVRESPSMVAWQRMQEELRGRENSVPTVITGESLDELMKNFAEASERIENARAEGLLASAVVPGGFIPNARNQRGNREAIVGLLAESDRITGEILAAGFSEEGAELTETIFDSWRDYVKQLETDFFAKPLGALGEWSIERLFAEEDGSYAALASVKPTNPLDRDWVNEICDENVTVASMGSLGTALNERIRSDLVRVFLPMAGLLSLMLTVVFRSWRDLLLSFFSLFFALAVLLLLTAWTPLSWNSFNVCGLPLLFGTGLDFGIHMIFALRRCGGDVGKARQGVGKALVFCGSSSAIGFGSLATASAHGLSSLGIVCAVGILVNMVVAVWLLPRWYQWIHRKSEKSQQAEA